MMLGGGRDGHRIPVMKDGEVPGYAQLVQLDEDLLPARVSLLVPHQLFDAINEMRTKLSRRLETATPKTLRQAALPIPKDLADEYPDGAGFAGGSGTGSESTAGGATRSGVAGPFGGGSSSSSGSSLGNTSGNNLSRGPGIRQSDGLRDKPSANFPDLTKASASTSATTSTTGAGSAKARRPGMRQVQMVDMKQIEQRKDDKTITARMSRDERQAHEALFEQLIQKGPLREVGLRADWQSLLQRMEDEMPAFRKPLEHVWLALNIAKLTKRPPLIQPILLAGLPGTGKTHFAQRLGELFGTNCFVYSMESAENNSLLLGTDKHWGNAHPGELFRLLVQGDHANPVVVLDEIDKAPTEGRYNTMLSVLPLLEPNSARQVRDKCLEVVFNARHVVYVATANKLGDLPGSLLTRFAIFHIPPLDARGKVALVQSVSKAVYEDMGISHRLALPSGEIGQTLAMFDNARAMSWTIRRLAAHALMAGSKTIRLKDLERLMPGYGGTLQAVPGRGGRNGTSGTHGYGVLQ